MLIFKWHCYILRYRWSIGRRSRKVIDFFQCRINMTFANVNSQRRLENIIRLAEGRVTNSSDCPELTHAVVISSNTQMARARALRLLFSL